MLAINVAALVTNVVLCLALLPAVGLVGGALALAASDCLQSVLLVVTASRAERVLVAPALATAVAGSLMLALTGIAFAAGLVGLALLGVALTIVVVAFRMPWSRPREAALT